MERIITPKTPIPSSPYTTSPCTDGLEKNYCVETIDLKTVRPFTKVIKKEPTPQISYSSKIEQLCFPLGPFFDKAIPSLKLQESIDAIALSPLAKQALKAANIQTLHELVKIRDDLLKIKGIGRGHVDEIHEKLERYLGPTPLFPTTIIDLKSLVAFLFAGQMPLARTVLLTKYGLSHLFPLQSSDVHEAQRMTSQAKIETIKAIKTALLQKRDPLFAILRTIAEAFLYPFLQERLGLGELWELQACLFSHCSQAECEENRAIILMLEELFDLSFLFDPFLARVSKNVYANSLPTEKNASLVIEQAKKYFYNPATTFPLDSLKAYLERDFALQWIHFPEGFIDKILRLSDAFVIYRDKNIFIGLKI